MYLIIMSFIAGVCRFCYPFSIYRISARLFLKCDSYDSMIDYITEHASLSLVILCSAFVTLFLPLNVINSFAVYILLDVMDLVFNLIEKAVKKIKNK